MSIDDTVGFLFEMGLLKRSKRSGWWIAGIRDPESVAEHSHRAAVIATVLAAMEGADPARAALLATLHDTQETRTLDLPHVTRRYVTPVGNEVVTADQVAGCPPAVASVFRDAVAEYEAGQTPEAVVAHDADKLECLLQAVEYWHQGVATVQPWIDSCRAALRTAGALEIAEAALTADPLGWQTPRTT